MTNDRHADAPLTLTHARLRASQGDLDTARRVLRAILAADPGHVEALDLLRALGEEIGGPEPVASERPEEEREPATAEDLAGRFRTALAAEDARAERLRRWVETIRRNRGARRHAG